MLRRSSETQQISTAGHSRKDTLIGYMACTCLRFAPTGMHVLAALSCRSDWVLLFAGCSGTHQK
jgi:hypothetical protein